MGPMFFGDRAQAQATSLALGKLKSTSVRLAEELGSGRKADVAAGLGGDLRELLALRRTAEVGTAVLRMASEAALRAEGRQTVLTQMQESLGNVSSAVATLFPETSPERKALAAGTARAALADTLAKLNTVLGGRALFAGTLSSGPAVIQADDLLSRLTAELTGAVTQEDVSSRIEAWFNDPNGWAAQGYQGGPAATALTLGPGGPQIADRTATDPRLRGMLAALATAAFLDRSPASAAPETMAGMALSRLADAKDGLVALSAEIGVDEERIAATRAGREAEAFSIEMAIAARTGADPARTAIELEATRTSLETLYAVTARMSRLSLADFLR